MTLRTRWGALSLWAKQRMVHSPIEPAFRQVQLAGEWIKGRRDPEFAKLHREKAAIRQALALMVEPDSVCIDVGGHVGSVLSDFCRLAPRARHIVIEADPAKAGSLRRRFPEVEVVAAAVMGEPGVVRFEVDLQRGGYSHVVLATDEDGATGTTRVIEVEAITLDGLIGDRRLGVMKLDVEGAELVALQGASGVLSNQRPRILFEAGFVPGDLWESSLPDLFRVLEDAGYTIFLVTDFVDGAAPIDLDGFIRAHQHPFQAWNYVALPKEDPLIEKRPRRAA